MMEFLILGTTEVLEGTQRLDLPMGHSRTLLVLLALHTGETVAADRLIDAIWDEHPPPTAATVVQGLVSKLRRILEPGKQKGRSATILQTVGNGYRLAVDPDAVDANRFKRLLDEARAAPPDARVPLFSAALDLWRGPALADCTYLPFAQRAIATLDELRLQATEGRIEAELALGRGSGSIAELRSLVIEHPFRERLRWLQMLTLYRNGQQSEALEAYREARALLVEEMGVEPGTELRDLHAAILRQDPSLELKPPAAEEPARPGADAWLPRERRPVTVLVADVSPWGDEDADAEAVAHLSSRAAASAAALLERHGARVERLLGTMVIGVFGFPAAHEDDALRAARAALEVRTAIEALNDEPTVGRLRAAASIGIETGDVLVRGPGASVHDLAGPVMMAATRLHRAAGDGVVVGLLTQRLLRGAAIMKAVDGSDEGSAGAWRILEILPHAQAVPRAMQAVMVGREAEMTQLRAAFRRMVRQGGPVRFCVVGEAGIGKSRLAREVVASVGSDAHTITLTPPAQRSAFYPLRQAMVEAAGVFGWRALHDRLAADNDGEHVPAEIAAATGLQVEASVMNLLVPAMRHFFELLSQNRPLIVVLDDLHWAGSAFLDLIDHVAKDTSHPILLLCVGRPELLERRPAWSTGDVLHVDALPSHDLEQLIRDRATTITSEALGRILDVSRGNPLFAEQLLAARSDGNDDPVPASLLGLLTMRLDRLGPAERDLLRCASIVGMDVDLEAVSALLPDKARPFLPQHIETLEHRGLIERTGQHGFHFRHVLIQLTAYRSMTREDREGLHGRFAEWLEATPGRQGELNDDPRHQHAQAADQRRGSGLATDLTVL